MVHWYHAIFSAYGYWLPNDPRGSWSDFVHSWELFRFGGEATTVTGRRSYAHDPHDAEFRRQAKEHLKYPAVRFHARQRGAIARGLADACGKSDVTLYACAIGYDHVHLVAARHATLSIEKIVRSLKSGATRSLTAQGLHPLAQCASRGSPAPTPWSEGLWKVFVNDEAQLRAAIAYVARHSRKEGLPDQQWPFLASFV